MATVSENSLAAAVDRFLQYLRVERNASLLTIKSYREDLEALMEFLGERHRGELPRAGRSDDARPTRLRFGPAHGRLREDNDRPAAGLAAKLLSFGQREGGPRPIRPSRCAILRRGRSLPHFLSSGELDRLLMYRRRRTTPWGCAIGRFSKRSIGRPAR